MTVGFLGVFTKFSTFALETTVLLESGRLATALGYAVVSVLLFTLAVAAGWWAAKLLA